MAIVNGGLDAVLYDHEKRIRDLERRPLGCLEFHDHFYIVVQPYIDAPPEPIHLGPGVGALVRDTGRVWAVVPDGLGGWVWADTGTIDDWLPDPTPTG